MMKSKLFFSLSLFQWTDFNISTSNIGSIRGQWQSVLGVMVLIGTNSFSHSMSMIDSGILICMEKFLYRDFFFYYLLEVIET